MTILRSATAVAASASTLVGRRGSNSNILLNPYSGLNGILDVFSETPTALPAQDKIHNLLTSISSKAPKDISSFNLVQNSVMGKLVLRGLRIRKEGAAGVRPVVIVTGNQVLEGVPIGVGVYVAEALAKEPIKGVEVTMFPVVQPLEYEEHRKAQLLGKSSTPMSQFAEEKSPLMALIEKHKDRISAPVQNYIMRRCTNYLQIEMDLSCNSTKLRYNTLDIPFAHANGFKANIPSIDNHLFAQPGEQTLFGALVGAPGIVLELRDRRNELGVADIERCGDQVIETIHQLVKKTSIARGLVL